MPPKTGVSDVADSIARYQVKQNELESLNNDKIKNKSQPTVTIEDAKLIANKNTNNQSASRKRLNSFESVSGPKRKCLTVTTTEDKSKQQSSTQKNAQVRLPSSSISLNSSNQIKQIKNKTLILNEKQQQPKLLIMSTGSVLNASNKSIVNTIAHPQNSLQNIITSSDQLIKLERINDETNKNKTSTTLVSTQSPSSTIKTTLSSTSTPNDVPVSLVTTSSAKIYNPKVQNTANISSKLMFLPNNTQGKTLTIPINHNVKTFQLPAQNSTIFYSTQQQLVNSTTANAFSKTTLVPGITIQAIKTTQGNKSNNFIIMPNKAAGNVSTTNAQQVSQAQLAGAKGLLRQMNAKEFPLKFISTTATPANATNKKDATDNQLNESVQNLTNERQPTIILTNLSKETANSLTGNLVNKNQGSIIKVIPKDSTASGTSTAKFMEILKKTIPANRISVASSGQLTNNKPVVNNVSNQSGSNKTINPVTNSVNPVSNPVTKALKIPTVATTATIEPITKLILSNVANNQCVPIISSANSTNSGSLSNDSSNNQVDSSANNISATSEQDKDSSATTTSSIITSTDNTRAKPESKPDLVQMALDDLNKDEVVESTT